MLGQGARIQEPEARRTSPDITRNRIIREGVCTSSVRRTISQNLLCVATALIAGAASAQDELPSFTLAPQGGHRFRMGETITVELRFQTSGNSSYRIFGAPEHRTVRIPRWDRFTAEPRDGVAGPMEDIPAQLHGDFGIPPQPLPLGSQPVVVVEKLNEWLSFRKPGQYRIVAETSRVRRSDSLGNPVPLRSNPIEIEIVEPEPQWALNRLQESIVLLERGVREPAIGQTADTAGEEAVIRAAKTIRFLESPGAARALARFFENGPPQAQADLRAGLFASPYRKQVIEAMEEAVKAPGRPVTYYYLGTLIELAALQTFGPQPLYPAGEPDQLARWNEGHQLYLDQMKPLETKYFQMLAEAIQRKTGEARAISLETLVMRGPRPPAAAALGALMENFDDLPAGSQQLLLSHEWPRIASPSLQPLVRRIAISKSPARDAALLRLHELDPEAALAITLERLRNADLAVSAGPAPMALRALLLLPDPVLPALDGPLTEALEQGEPAEAVIARYASEAALPRVRAWYQKNLATICGGPLFAYFFRVDPAYARDVVSRARSTNPDSCLLNLAPFEDLLINPELERAAIDDLRHPSPMVQRAAETILKNAGSAAARQPLWDVLARLRESGVDPMRQASEFGAVEALLQGNGWVLTKAERLRLVDACVTSHCRSYVESQIQALSGTIHISVRPDEPWGVMTATYWTHSRKAFEAKIRQFPSGTRFQVASAYPGTWFGGTRAGEIRAILQGASMIVDDKP